MRVTCALECKVCKMSVLSCFNALCKSFDTLKLCEIYCCVSTHLLGKFKTFCISVYCADVLNTHGVKNCDTDQTDRSASLYNNSAVEFEDTCCFCSFYCMYKYCTWLDKDTGIQIQITYIEECGTEFSASDEDVISEPSVEFNIIIRKKSVNISAANVFLVEVEHCDFRIIFEDHTCNNFITDLNRFTSCINFNVFTHSYDLTCSFVSENNRDQIEWVIFVFVSICTTNATAFYFNKDIVVTDFRKRILLKFEVFLFCHHCNSCCFRDSTLSRSCRCSCLSCCRCCSGHSGENLFYNFFNIYIVHIHFKLSS